MGPMWINLCSVPVIGSMLEARGARLELTGSSVVEMLFLVGMCCTDASFPPTFCSTVPDRLVSGGLKGHGGFTTSIQDLQFLSNWLLFFFMLHLIEDVHGAQNQ